MMANLNAFVRRFVANDSTKKNPNGAFSDFRLHVIND
jgi:hypothetical protein